MAEATANIGVIGLAAMGSNLARNLAHHGNTVALFNRHYSRTEKLMNEHGAEGKFVPAETLKEFAASLKRPRTAIIMVKAGAPTDATIEQLEEVFEPGDIIVDGGNSFFKDTIKREKEVRAKGFHFVGCGVSGGEEGALNGPSLMPGGTGKPFVDVVVDHAGMKGTGTWTVQTGLEFGSPVAAIGEAVFARALSSHGELREDAQKEGLAGPNKTIDLAGEDKAAFIEDVRKALFASKVVAYAQGLNEIQDGAKEYGWDINLSEVARIWRGGCIIRAQFLLDRITEAFKGDNPPASLLFDPYFEKIIGESQDAWRRVIVRAVEAGIPTPVFSSSLAYYDGLRSKRLPTALTQSQRDLFGAHTYGRVDKPGVFHTLWAEEGKPEIEA